MISRSIGSAGLVVFAVGGLLLLVALFAPIDWFKEVSSGGLDGKGTGEPPRYLSAWDEFDLWTLPIAAAALAPAFCLAAPALRTTWGTRGVFLIVLGGLVVLAVGTAIALDPSGARYPDEVYWHPYAEVGVLLAAIGATLLALGTLAWIMRPGRRF